MSKLFGGAGRGPAVKVPPSAPRPHEKTEFVADPEVCRACVKIHKSCKKPPKDGPMWKCRVIGVWMHLGEAPLVPKECPLLLEFVLFHGNKEK
jgi:hypothetical protein